LLITQLGDEPPRSVLFGEHDCDHALGEGWLGWVVGVPRERWVVIIDFKKDHVAVGFERAKVMLLVGIIGMTKVVVYGDCLDNASDSFGTKSRYSLGYHCCAFAEVLPQLIVTSFISY
jgi:hypothetical protein